MARILGYDISITGRVLQGPIPMLDGQSTFQTLLSLSSSGANSIEMQYSVQRGTDRATGYIFIATNGLSASITDYGTDLINVGVEFEAIISGANMIVQYKTTSTGVPATFKYYIDAWN